VFRLIIEDDEGYTTVVPLVKDEISIGRKEGNLIRLTERNVSRHHACVVQSAGSVFIDDLDSYNGIKINGERVSARTTLNEGDLIEIGDYHLALQVLDEDAEETQPNNDGDGTTAVMRLPLDKKASQDTTNKSTTVIDDAKVACLIALNTDLVGQRFLLDRTKMIVGRTEDNDIVLPHRSISSHHATIAYENGIFRVRDLESANGLMVNGEEYSSIDVRMGDIIELGHVKLRYVTPGENPIAAMQRSLAHPMDSAFEGQVGTEDTSKDQGQEQEEELVSGKKFRFGWVLLLFVLLAGVAGGVYYFLVLKPEEMATEARQAFQQAESEARRAFFLGEDFLGSGDLEAAKTAYNKCLKISPNHSGAIARLLEVQNEESALSLLAQAKAFIEEKEWDLVLTLLNDIHADTKAYSEAETLKPEVFRKFRSHHLSRAEAFEADGKLSDALGEYGAILMYDKNNFLAKTKRDRLQKKLHATKKKIRPAGPSVLAVETQNTRERSRSRKMLQQGVEAFHRRDFMRAISLLHGVLKFNAPNPEVYRWLGSCYAQTGQRRLAYTNYRKYLEVCLKCTHASNVRLLLQDYEGDSTLGIQP
jgi:pSer/pThr/pTyr-binding forkhead associated (FHA) protein/Tfp pilus assembly protein PilF